MGALFDYDSLISRIIHKVGDCAMLSLLWLVFCIPIVTIGASTTALYYTAYKVIRRSRSSVWREFWDAFKTNFKQATIAEGILILLYGFTGIICYLYYVTGVLRFGVMVVLYLLIVALLTMWGLYVFPYMARFQNTMKGIFMNAGFMCTKYIFRSILMLAFLVLAAVLYILFPTAVLFVPAGYAVLVSRLVEGIFAKYMTEEDFMAEEERNAIHSNEIG